MYCEEKIVNECYARLTKNLNNIKNYDYEIIFVDDGSTDKNVDNIIQSYITTDARFTTTKIPNSGQGVARNLGIEYFLNIDKTDYILFYNHIEKQA